MTHAVATEPPPSTTGASDAIALPPGPREPSIVQIGRYLADPVGHLQRCRDRYGPVFTLSWPGAPRMVYFTEPEPIEQIFKASPEILCGGRSNSVLDFVAGPRSVARLDGQPHRKRRGQVTPPFVRLDAYAARMEANTLALFGAVGPGPVSFQEQSQTLALRNLIHCTLGIDDPRRALVLEGLVLDFMRGSLNPVMATLWTAMSGARLRKALVRYLAPLARVGAGRLVPFAGLAETIRRLDAFLHEEIALRRKALAAGAAPRDVLGLLVGSADEDGRAMSDEDLRDEMMAILVAGHETTSTTMDWFVVESLSRPEVLRRLRDEVDRVVGSGPVTPAVLPDLKYLGAVVDECLRLHPPVPAVGRYVAREVEIGGVRLPEGAVATPSILLLHLDPKVWEAPHEFRPERFLDRRPPAGTHIPFGGGSRTCLGKRFALFQLELVLATLLSRFDLVPVDWPAARLVQRGLFTGVSHPVRVEVGRR